MCGVDRRRWNRRRSFACRNRSHGDPGQQGCGQAGRSPHERPPGWSAHRNLLVVMPSKVRSQLARMGNVFATRVIFLALGEGRKGGIRGEMVIDERLQALLEQGEDWDA